jgi:hypothetical protein
MPSLQTNMPSPEQEGHIYILYICIHIYTCGGGRLQESLDGSELIADVGLQINKVYVQHRRERLQFTICAPRCCLVHYIHIDACICACRTLADGRTDTPPPTSTPLILHVAQNWPGDAWIKTQLSPLSLLSLSLSREWERESVCVCVCRSESAPERELIWS